MCFISCIATICIATMHTSKNASCTCNYLSVPVNDKQFHTNNATISMYMTVVELHTSISKISTIKRALYIATCKYKVYLECAYTASTTIPLVSLDYQHIHTSLNVQRSIASNTYQSIIHSLALPRHITGSQF